LGLNIAYNLAELLGPRNHQGIKVASSLNEGSTFSFMIEDKETLEILEISSDPCEVASEELAVAVQPSRTLKPLPLETPQSQSELLVNVCTCSKVLIVDDNPFNTMALETILSSLELKCDSVYSGSGCIKKLLERQNKTYEKNCRPYSVVFMDQEMPGMSGVEAVNEIKKLQKENLVSSEMKIIGCTAHKSGDEVDKFMASGLNQCIAKPISMVLIKDILKEVSPKE